MAPLHNFTLFCTFKTMLKFVIYTFMGYVLTGIDVLCIFMSLNLLAIHVIACCLMSDI